MRLKELSTTPQLIRVVLDDEETIKEYGEEIEFYVYDKQPLAKFVKFMNADTADFDPVDLIAFCSEMIFDEDGQPVMTEGEVLPTKVLIRCINEVISQLGK